MWNKYLSLMVLPQCKLVYPRGTFFCTFFLTLINYTMNTQWAAGSTGWPNGAVSYTWENVNMPSRAAPFRREPEWETTGYVSVSCFYVFLSIARPDQWYFQVLTASIHPALITPSLLTSVKWCLLSLSTECKSEAWASGTPLVRRWWVG